MPQPVSPASKPPLSIDGKSVYMVLVDRFAKAGLPPTATACSGSRWCGGTLRGLIEKLDYIAGMGFDCVWMTPVVTQAEAAFCTQATHNSEACKPFHGYWSRDLYGIDPHFGTMEDLK
eukprot:7021189-Prymnesium_polylepis.1